MSRILCKHPVLMYSPLIDQVQFLENSLPVLLMSDSHAAYIRMQTRIQAVAQNQWRT